MKRRKFTPKQWKPYWCYDCERAFPSPESAEAHLQKRHEGIGVISYRNAPIDAARRLK